MFIRPILEWYVLFLTCSLFKCAYQTLFFMKTILNYFKLKERQTLMCSSFYLKTPMHWLYMYSTLPFKQCCFNIYCVQFLGFIVTYMLLYIHLFLVLFFLTCIFLILIQLSMMCTDKIYTGFNKKQVLIKRPNVIES